MLCFSICHTCWYGVSLSAVPAGVMPYYRPYLLMWCLNISPAELVWCLSVGHAFWCGASLQATTGNSFWCGASLSAMPAGVLPHYRSCLLVWCLIINHAYWCVASLWVMPSGVVPHHQPCLLVWFLTVDHACWRGTSLKATAINILLVECRWKKGGYKSGAVQRHHYIRHVC